jgi:hypothetical protein
MMWCGHFQPILLSGALVEHVIPMHMACTQYSHVSFVLPRLETCEHPTHIALTSFLPSPQILHISASRTVEKEELVVCVVWFFLLEAMGDSDKAVDGPGSFEVDAVSDGEVEVEGSDAGSFRTIEFSSNININN